MRKILVQIAAIVSLIALAAITTRDGLPARGTTGAVIVSVDVSASVPEVSAEIARQGFTATKQFEDLHAVEVRVAGDPSRVATELGSLHGVRYAEPVRRVVLADSPNEPLFSQQSSYLSAVNAQQAWNITTGSPNIIVAVVDTGVDVAHPDLQQNIWVNPGEIPNNGIDDDNNGCVDDVNGCAFVSDSSPGCENTTNGFVRDDIGHGTFVSGVIASPVNGQGIVGVARNVKIMPVKVLDCYGAGDSVATARGILYAAHNGARVINLSLGGLDEAQVVVDAINEATADGVLVVAAAGNGGGPGVAFPARLPQVLAVGAAAAANPNARATFSSWGPEVDVVAVGEQIVGPVPPSRCNVILPCVGNTPYGVGDGTSFSTPQVSGLAALMLSLRSSLTPAQIIDIIKGTATALPPGTTPGWAGAGRINMSKALQAVQQDHPTGDPCVIASVESGETFTCQGGRQVRLLQVDVPAPGQCGGDWAKAALQNIFLTPGRTVYLQYDATKTDAQGRTLAVPIWRGDDGNDYNLSIIMVYVGLAHAADVGAGNVMFHDWAFASETWARVAQFNMWAPGKTFNGGC